MPSNPSNSYHICTHPIPTFCKFVKFNRKQSKFNLHHKESSQQRENKRNQEMCAWAIY